VKKSRLTSVTPAQSLNWLGICRVPTSISWQTPESSLELIIKPEKKKKEVPFKSKPAPARLCMYHLEEKKKKIMPHYALPNTNGKKKKKKNTLPFYTTRAPAKAAPAAISHPATFKPLAALAPADPLADAAPVPLGVLPLPLLLLLLPAELEAEVPSTPPKILLGDSLVAALAAAAE
jgi:hypothetical protein